MQGLCPGPGMKRSWLLKLGWGGKMGKKERGRGEAVTWLLLGQLSPILFMQSEATMSAVLGFGGASAPLGGLRSGKQGPH